MFRQVGHSLRRQVFFHCVVVPVVHAELSDDHLYLLKELGARGFKYVMVHCWAYALDTRSHVASNAIDSGGEATLTCSRHFMRALMNPDLLGLSPSPSSLSPKVPPHLNTAASLSFFSYLYFQRLFKASDFTALALCFLFLSPAFFFRAASRMSR